MNVINVRCSALKPDGLGFVGLRSTMVMRKSDGAENMKRFRRHAMSKYY